MFHKLMGNSKLKRRGFVAEDLKSVGFRFALSIAELGELPSRETSPVSFDVPADTSVDNQVSEHFFHDSTERPIQRPKDLQLQKETYYSGKRNNGPSRITLLSMLRAKSCY